jgi:hypothetical protein
MYVCSFSASISLSHSISLSLSLSLTHLLSPHSFHLSHISHTYLPPHLPLSLSLTGVSLQFTQDTYSAFEGQVLPNTVCLELSGALAATGSAIWVNVTTEDRSATGEIIASFVKHKTCNFITHASSPTPHSHALFFRTQSRVISFVCLHG